MTHKTYSSTARNSLGALNDISAKLDRLIDLIGVMRPSVGAVVPIRVAAPRRRRLAS